MQPKTRQDFIEYCLRKLGHPVIRVNISPEQMDDRVDDAINRFREHHFDGTEEQYVIVEITDTDVTNGYIEMPVGTYMVANVYRPQGSGGSLFSPEYQTYMSEINVYNQTNRSNNSIDHLYMTRSHFSLMRNMLVPELTFAYNGKTRRLSIAGGLKNVDWTDGHLILHVYKSLELENPDNIIDFDYFENLWTEKWLQDYATELLRMQWGQNLSKFQNVQMVGGVTLNGAEIKQEAQQNIDKLEEKLLSEYSLMPIGGFY